jgi:transposase
MECMLTARAALWRRYLKLHNLAVGLVARDELCRRFMAIPGVGPVSALTLSAAIDDPSRFRRSRDVAAYFGLTSKRWQSGASIDVPGRISKAGDPHVRRALYEAASAMLTRYKGKTALKSWGQKIAKRCQKKSVVAVARKLAVIMHAMWRDGSRTPTAPPAARRPPRSASFRAFSHDVQEFVQPPTGVRLTSKEIRSGG